MPQSKVQCPEVTLHSVELFLNRSAFTVSRTREIQSYSQLHQRPLRCVTDWEHLSYDENLRVGSVQPGDGKAYGGDSTVCANI